MLDFQKEKKTIEFLSDLVRLYEKHGVTTYEDWDYYAVRISDDIEISNPDYDGRGYISHYLPIHHERLGVVGDKMFLGDVVKEVDNPDADRIIEASNMRYQLRCDVYPDKVEFIVSASAFNKETGKYEDRDKPISAKDLASLGGSE